MSALKSLKVGVLSGACAVTFRSDRSVVVRVGQSDSHLCYILFVSIEDIMSYGRGPPAIEGMVSLKVDNLTYRTTPEDLRRTFEKYGDVGDVYIPRDRFNRESRGFAFVRFYDRRDAEDAMDSMDGAILDGREVRCQMARYGRPADPYRRGPAPSRRSGRYRLEMAHFFKMADIWQFASVLASALF